MNITVVNDCAFEAVSLNQIVKHVGFSGSDADTFKLLERMARSARIMIENRKQVAICKKVVDIYFEKDYDMNLDRNILIMPVAPVNSITKFYSYDQYNNETELTENTDYYLRGQYRKELYVTTMENTIISGSSTDVIAWKAEDVSVGYDLDEIPDIYKDAILKLVFDWYDHKGNYVPQLTSEVEIMLMGVNDTI